jgi:hypothetical protein
MLNESESIESEYKLEERRLFEFYESNDEDDYLKLLLTELNQFKKDKQKSTSKSGKKPQEEEKKRADEAPNIENKNIKNCKIECLLNSAFFILMMKQVSEENFNLMIDLTMRVLNLNDELDITAALPSFKQLSLIKHILAQQDILTALISNPKEFQKILFFLHDIFKLYTQNILIFQNSCSYYHHISQNIVFYTLHLTHFLKFTPKSATKAHPTKRKRRALTLFNKFLIQLINKNVLLSQHLFIFKSNPDLKKWISYFAFLNKIFKKLGKEHLYLFHQVYQKFLQFCVQNDPFQGADDVLSRDFVVCFIS